MSSKAHEPGKAQKSQMSRVKLSKPVEQHAVAHVEIGTH